MNTPILVSSPEATARYVQKLWESAKQPADWVEKFWFLAENKSAEGFYVRKSNASAARHLMKVIKVISR